MAVMENGGKGMGIGLGSGIGLMNFGRLASDVDPGARYENPIPNVFVQLENVRISQNFEQNVHQIVQQNIQLNVQENVQKPEQILSQRVRNLQHNVHENDLQKVHDNVYQNVRDNVHQNVRDNAHQNVGDIVQDNVDQKVSDNIHDTIHQSVCENGRGNDQQSIEQNLLQNADEDVKQVEYNLQQNAQYNSEQIPQQTENGVTLQDNGKPPQASNNGLNRDMRELVDMLSKLNPSAKEFFPSSLADRGSPSVFSNLTKNNNSSNRRKKINNNQGKRAVNSRTSRAQREESIRRTVYVSDIDQQVTEEQLAALFINCGQVVDCRVCGDPNSVLRFAFVEFTDDHGARAALSLAGTMLGYYPVRVLPSKTAIAPVNPTFLPRSEDEREMCARTIYCTNIDKKVSQSEVKMFFESLCGEVSRLRLLGDFHHSTRIAFVEFVMVGLN
eukprot:Gb_33869 [translate_table: standard]